MKLLAVYKSYSCVLVVPYSRNFTTQGSNVVLLVNIEKYSWPNTYRINKPIDSNNEVT